METVYLAHPLSALQAVELGMTGPAVHDYRVNEAMLVPPATAAKMRASGLAQSTAPANPIADVGVYVRADVVQTLTADQQARVRTAIGATAGAGAGIDPEAVMDIVGATVKGSGLVQVVFSDSGDTTTVSTTATQNSADSVLLSRANHTGTQTSASISDFTEAAQDAIAAMFAAGTQVGISYTYDDAGNKIGTTVTGGGGTFDAEAAQDAIGSLMVGVGVITVAYNDAANSLTISSTATQNSTDAALRDRGSHTGTQSIASITGLQDLLDAKQALLPTGGTTAHYLRGDQTWQTLNPSAVGLGNLTNTLKAEQQHTHNSTQITDFTEAAQDASAVMLSSGVHSGISFVYDDANNRVNATVSGGGGGGGTTTLIPDIAPTTGPAQLSGGQWARVDATASSRRTLDGVTVNASKTLTSATMAFAAADVGKPVYGLGIALGATIASVESATSVTMSANATASLSSVNLTVGNGALVVTLPAGAPTGTLVRVEKVDTTAKAVQVNAPAGETAEGLTTIRVRQTVVTFVKGANSVWSTSAINDAPVYPQARGNRLSALGDSIGPGLRENTGDLGAGGSNWAWWAHILSGGRLIASRLAGIGSQRGDMLTARLHNDVLSAPADFVVCDASFTNSGSAGFTPTTVLNYLRSQVADVLAQGAIPVLHTGYPVPIAYRPLIDQYRRGVLAYGAAAGLIIVDTYGAVADPTTGGYLAIYDSGDGIHPNNLGKRAIGQAFATVLADFFGGFTPQPQTVNDAASTSSLLPNGLFLTDTNADGTPDGWVKGGTNATYSLVSGDAAIRGNAFRVTATASGFTQAVTGTLTNTGTGRGGHRISVCGKYKSDSTAGGSALALTLSSPTAGKSVSSTVVSLDNQSTDGWRTFYAELTAPTDCNGISMSFSTGGGTGVDGSIAQLRIDDLTNDGVIL